ncbi:MAG TPA: hypothetical protein VFH47_06885 [Candidatus Thermoplasmatota archaeon]|nr:hypothetical protein [Candidatus Thermoplasmatota archaeon]
MRDSFAELVIKHGAKGQDRDAGLRPGRHLFLQPHHCPAVARLPFRLHSGALGESEHPKQAVVPATAFRGFATAL